MKSIRRFTYAVVLLLSALSFAPSPASAQEAGGTFTLAHDVHWQNTIVRAGKYRFTIGAEGPSDLLTLSPLTGSGAGLMILVTDTESSKPSDRSQLVVVSRPGGTFVSTMQLPEIGVTLHFAVPAEPREIAKAATTTANRTTTASAAR